MLTGLAAQLLFRNQEKWRLQDSSVEASREPPAAFGFVLIQNLSLHEQSQSRTARDLKVPASLAQGLWAHATMLSSFYLASRESKSQRLPSYGFTFSPAALPLLMCDSSSRKHHPLFFFLVGGGGGVDRVSL